MVLVDDGKDKEKFFELLKRADVLVESFRPGVFEKLIGVSVDQLVNEYPNCKQVKEANRM